MVHKFTWIIFLQANSLAKTDSGPEPSLHGCDDIRPLSMDDFKFAHEQV
jgi:hypothetical protein